MTPEQHGAQLTREWSPGRAPWEDRERVRAREAMARAIAVATAAVAEPVVKCPVLLCSIRISTT